jgi:hypothetical protein
MELCGPLEKHLGEYNCGKANVTIILFSISADAGKYKVHL